MKKYAVPTLVLVALLGWGVALAPLAAADGPPGTAVCTTTRGSFKPMKFTENFMNENLQAGRDEFLTQYYPTIKDAVLCAW